MCFPHARRIVTINQLSFVGTDLTTNNPTSLSVPNVQLVSSSPHVNYVTTYPIHIPTNEDKHFIVHSNSFNLDLVGDMMNHLLGKLEFIFPLDPLICIPSISLFFHLMRTSWKSWHLGGHVLILE